MLWALLGAVFVGLSLGLLGSGGAILTVPILVYLVKHSEKVAIVESLAIVGSIAFVAALRALFNRNVDLRSALLLSLGGIPGTYLGVLLATVLTGSIQLAILAALMLLAAALILKSPPSPPSPTSSPPSIPSPAQSSQPSSTSLLTNTTSLIIVLIQGATLGLITGLVGVGGGFLIIPLLLLVRKLPMATAVGTSLVIISINSVTGLLKNLLSPNTPELNWQVIILFAIVGIISSQFGLYIAHRISQTFLKRTFAIFLIFMAISIFVLQHPRFQPEHLKVRISQPSSASPSSNPPPHRPPTD